MLEHIPKRERNGSATSNIVGETWNTKPGQGYSVRSEEWCLIIATQIMVESRHRILNIGFVDAFICVHLKVFLFFERTCSETMLHSRHLCLSKENAECTVNNDSACAAYAAVDGTVTPFLLLLLFPSIG